MGEAHSAIGNVEPAEESFREALGICVPTLDWLTKTRISILVSLERHSLNWGKYPAAAEAAKERKDVISAYVVLI